MKKFEIIRKLYDHVAANGVSYQHTDAISEGCTRDGFMNPVFVKKVEVNMPLDAYGHRCDNITITGQDAELHDATDADVRITFLGGHIGRSVLYANEVGIPMLEQIYNHLKLS